MSSSSFHVSAHDPLTEMFRVDVVHGLSQAQKSVPCKWLYDNKGAELFEHITALPEYYPPRVETALLHEAVSDIAARAPQLQTLIELGSGSSVKTRVLLRTLASIRRYFPVDLSEEQLWSAARKLRLEFPALAVRPFVADFASALRIAGFSPAPGNAMCFFPGSTIGNFLPAEVVGLLSRIRETIGTGNWLLIGVDMTQDPALLLPAYDDAQGITARFNLNLLERINWELDADFEPRLFAHRALYNVAATRIEMHLVSRKVQSVCVGNLVFHFEKGETIHTENSHKYSRTAFEQMATQAEWQTERVWQDHGESAFGVFLLRAAER